MKKLQLFFLIYTLFPIICNAAEKKDIALEAEFLMDKMEIKFHIKNLSSENVEFDFGKLPWGYSTSVWMQLESFNKNCPVLQEYSALENVPLTKKFIQIPPMVTTYGNVQLLNHWPGLKNREKKCQDVLFWSYELIDRTNFSYGRFSGAFPIIKE